MNRPDFVTDEHLAYLDTVTQQWSPRVRFQTIAALRELFGLNQEQAAMVLGYYWYAQRTMR